MTLYGDDQQVPQTSFDYVNGSSGGTVINTGKSLPDFDCLLQGLSETQPRKEETPATATFETLTALDLDGGMADELNFYDDGLKRFVKEDLSSMHHYSPIEDHLQSQVVMDEVQKEINYVSGLLDIPTDPYVWSVDQAQKWLLWTLDQFKLPMDQIENFILDGTSLCMLSECDFRNRSPMVGPYLYPQLEIWKNARSLMRVPTIPTVEDYTLTDLDSMQRPAPMQAPPLTAIPTSVIMPPQNLSPAASTDSLDSGSSTGSWVSQFSMPQDTQEDDRRRAVPPRSHYAPTRHNTIHLWQFLKELLMEPHSFSGCIRWLDRNKGIFKIEDSARVAKLWGQRKNRPAMNYDKLSRSIRQYYKKGIIKKTEHSKRLVYQFCPQYML